MMHRAFLLHPLTLCSYSTLHFIISYCEAAYRIPESQLPLTHATEASSEDVSITKENGPHWASALVGFLFLL